MKLARKCPNITFSVITFLVTLLLFLISLWLKPTWLNLVQFGPAIAAYIMAALLGVGFAAFSKDIYLPKPKARWVLASIVLAIFIFWLGDSMERIWQNQQFPSFTPGPLFAVLFTFWGTVGTFLCSFAEEIGWRGFMLPRLANRYGNMTASVIIGVVWGLWHMGDYGEGFGFVLFVVGTVGMSVIMTWLQEKGGGSVWMAGLFHIFYNLSAKYFLSGIPANINTPEEIPGVSLVTRGAVAASCLIPAIVLVIVSPVFKKKIEFNKGTV